MKKEKFPKGTLLKSYEKKVRDFEITEEFIREYIILQKRTKLAGENLIKIEELSRKEVKSIPLKEVKKDEILPLRRSGNPGFILKKDGKFFYGKISEEFKIESSRGCHKCRNCYRLSAVVCPKVHFKSNNIELYDFIPYGYETFNVKNSAFVTLSCKNQKPIDDKEMEDDEY